MAAIGKLRPRMPREPLEHRTRHSSYIEAQAQAQRLELGAVVEQSSAEGDCRDGPLNLAPSRSKAVPEATAERGR